MFPALAHTLDRIEFRKKIRCDYTRLIISFRESASQQPFIMNKILKIFRPAPDLLKRFYELTHKLFGEIMDIYHVILLKMMPPPE